MVQYIAHICEDSIQTCYEHSIRTGEYAEKCLKNTRLGKTAYLAGILHDVGKFTEEFTEYITAASQGKSVRKGSIIHSFAGVKLILENYHLSYGKYSKQSGWESITAEMIATSIGCHHGLFDELAEEGFSALEYRCEKQPEYDNRAIAAFLSEVKSLDEITKNFKCAEKEIENIALKCYALAEKSTADRVNECFCFYIGILQRLLNSAVMDSDRTDTAEFMQGISFNDYTNKGSFEIWEDALNSLEKVLDSFPQSTEIQKARREMSDICAEAANSKGGIYRLNMPTGGGKTLSSLRYALAHAGKFEKDRILIAVPLLSVLDQNVDIVRNAIGNNDIVLEHHSDVIIDDFGEEELKKHEILIDTWEAPIIVTTFVQLLNAIFSGKTSAVRRFHSLCNSVIIIDEVQNVPEKMISLFTLAINFLSNICGATVVLCSATQPAFEDNVFSLIIDGDIIPSERLERYRKLFKRTKTYFDGAMTQPELIEHAKTLCDKHGNLLIICNTKKEASSIYMDLKKDDIFCVHLSTSLCMAHRKAELQKVTEMLSNGEKVICISTQLIEAGVDISFASVIRLTAGIDNIAQSAGRCNRHGEKAEIAPVEVISLKGENLSMLKEIEEAKNLTEELVIECRKHPEVYENDLISTKAIDFYYKRKFMELNAHLGRTEYVISDGRSMLDLLSVNINNINKDKWFMRQAFRTAGQEFKVFDSNSRTLIVPYNDEASKIINEMYVADNNGCWKKLRVLLDKAKRYTVQVFEYQYKQLQTMGAIIEIGEGAIAVLQQGYYDSELGIINPQDADNSKIDESYIL